MLLIISGLIKSVKLIKLLSSEAYRCNGLWPTIYLFWLNSLLFWRIVCKILKKF